MSVSSVTFTKCFLNKIEQNNEKKPEAPLALVLQGECDYNLSLSSEASLYNILEISKTHRVAIRVLGLKSLWRQTISQASQSYKQGISLLYVAMHGNAQQLECGKGELLKISDLEAEDFSSLTPNATIMLPACEAGLEFAPQLAKITGRVVLACKTEVDPITTVFAGCFNPPKLLCYHWPNDLLTRAYLPNGESEPLFVSEELKRELFSKKFEYLKDLASNGHAIAQLNVAEMFEDGIGIEQSEQQALFYYDKAAKLGLARAQFMVGVFYKLGRGGLAQSNEQAFHWYMKAAEQGHVRAQNSVGVFYHLGRPGVEQSDEKALYWYEKAQKQGEICALFNIGFYYEEGRGGLPKSDTKALQCYQHAAKCGHSHARFMMAIFHEEGRGGLMPSKEKALYYYRLIGGPEKIELIRTEIESYRITKLSPISP